MTFGLLILYSSQIFILSTQSFMVAYFRNLEDQIKRSARRDGENRQKEEKRQARRERRSPNQVTEKNFFSEKK